MADPEEEEQQNPNAIADSQNKLSIPTGRVKRIVKLDKDITRINSQALFLIASSTELFLQFLAEKSAHVTLEKKKRTVKVEHLRAAVKRHRPMSDFLLDSLPLPAEPSNQNAPKERAKPRLEKNPVPFATRSIEAFFQKFT